MKKCYICKLEKDESEFSLQSKVSEKRNPYCRPCHKEYMKLHYSKNKSKYMERARKSSPVIQQRNRRWIYEYKSQHPCKYCNESDACCLDFHHTSEDKDYDVSRMLTLSLERILKEIAKCDVVCANCHRKIHAGRTLEVYEGG